MKLISHWFQLYKNKFVMRNLSWLIPFKIPIATYGNGSAKPSRYSCGDKILQVFSLKIGKLIFIKILKLILILSVLMFRDKVLESLLNKAVKIYTLILRVRTGIYEHNATQHSTAQQNRTEHYLQRENLTSLNGSRFIRTNSIYPMKTRAKQNLLLTYL